MSPYRKFKKRNPRRWWGWLRCNLGRRGIILATLGMVWVIIGLGTFDTDPSGNYPWLTNHWWWEDIRATVWIATGIFAICCARLGEGKDSMGYVALLIMALYRLSAYGVEWLQWVITTQLPFISDHVEDGGVARGLQGAAIWLAVASLILIENAFGESDEYRLNQLNKERE